MLKVISSFLFFLGLFLLSIVYFTQKPLSSKDLKNYVGEYILFEGKVKEISKTKKNYTKLKICDTYGCVYAIIYTYRKINCSEVLIKGKVSEFMGKIYIHVFREKDILHCKS